MSAKGLWGEFLFFCKGNWDQLIAVAVGVFLGIWLAYWKAY